MDEIQIKQVMDALSKIEERLATAPSAEVVKELSEQQEKLAKQLLELQQKGIKLNSPSAEVKSLGQKVVESEGFKALRAGTSVKCRVEISETKDVANPMLTPTGGVAEAYRRPGINGQPTRPLTIESLFPSIPVTAPSFEYVQETQFQNKAAVVKEGDAKPFSDIKFDVKTGKVVTVAHLAKISKQMLEDLPALVAYLNMRMTYGVDLAVEDQLISGTGEDQLPGIFTEGNYTAHGAAVENLGDAPTLFDLILYAKAKVQSNYYRPNVILLNPMDWIKLQMAKNGSGDYYLGNPASTISNKLWGIDVLDSQAIPSGKFMVLDSVQAGTIWNRSGLVIELFEQDADNVQKNLITVRAERRLGFGIERPLALVGGELTVPSAD